MLICQMNSYAVFFFFGVSTKRANYEKASRPAAQDELKQIFILSDFDHLAKLHQQLRQPGLNTFSHFHHQNTFTLLPSVSPSFAAADR